MTESKKLNNFEIDKKAKELVDGYSAYQLARMYIDKSEKLDALGRKHTKSSHI